MAPVNVMCQMFQMSILTVRVSLSTSMMTLMAMARGMATIATLEAQVMGEAPGQPMSTTESERPKRLLMASAAGPSWSFMRLTMRPRPTKPTPIMSPARMALPGLTPSMMLRIAMMIGSITDAPISTMYWMTHMLCSLRGRVGFTCSGRPGWPSRSSRHRLPR